MLRTPSGFLAAAIHALLAMCLLTVACGQSPPAPRSRADIAAAPVSPATTPEAPVETAQRAQSGPPTTIADPRFAAPDWLGTRGLTHGQIANSAALETPAELVNRRIATIDLLEPPPTTEFVSSITSPVPDLIAARSTWHKGCPVSLAGLAYVTVSHHGFDEKLHTGELIVHHDVAEDIVGVFAKLHAAEFPIEQMSVISHDVMGGPPTGDHNTTSAFTCRSSVGGSRWSEHARGLAIDINPFHNPYLKGSRLIPELAAAYVDRANVRPGMILADDVVVNAFAEIGWHWGGEWNSALDYMHFSHNDR